MPEFDIFLAGGSQHMRLLRLLLPTLLPHGRVHLGASFLTGGEIAELRESGVLIHEPRYHAEGYRNFEAFCIRDIHRLVQAPYFVKLDADTLLQPDWPEYLGRCVEQSPDAVLWGPELGDVSLTVELTTVDGQGRIQSERQVGCGRKILGGFYFGHTTFFQQHGALQCRLADLAEAGCAGLPGGCGLDGIPINSSEHHSRLTGRLGGRMSACSEDSVRSLMVHLVTGEDGLAVVPGSEFIELRRNPHYRPAGHKEGVVCAA